MRPIDPAANATFQILEEQGAFSKYFLAPWYRWDSIFYVEIAEQGYADKVNTVWPPLYSLITRAVAWIFPPTLLAALVVSSLAAVVALALLYLVVLEFWDEKNARLTTLLLAAFPAAFFLVAAYTESLFLVFSLGCLFAYKKSKWAAAAALGAAAVLTRLQGIVLVFPMAWEVFNDLLRQRKISVGQLARRIAPGTAIVVTLLGYVLFVRYGLQADWPWQILSINWAQHMGWPWEGLLGNFLSLTFHPVLTPIPPITRIYDLLLVITAIVLLVLARKKIPAFFMVYAISQLLTIMIKVDNENLLVSAGRYLLGNFPILVAAALTLNKPAKIIWIGISIGSQIVLLILFYWWVWVA